MAIPPFKVKAIYDYSSPHEDDLNFPTGQIITVTEKEDEDWYVGEYTDASGNPHNGLFPKNFVEDYQPPVPSRPMRAPRPASEIRSPPPSAPAPVPQPESVQEAESDEEEREAEPAPRLPAQSKPAPPPVETSLPPPPPREEPAVRAPPPAAPSALQASDRQTSAAPKPAAAAPAPAPAPAPTGKKAPPPVVEKPSSFKDRLALFNKAAAAPVTPFKPSGSQPSFIKKPFVAPPPSSNAYVPAPRAEPVQKIYRREEDPEVKEREEQDRANAERAGLLPSEQTNLHTAASGDDAEEAPKPQSLKERIAMLQKQQMEQAARRSDVGQKEKPKKPPVKKPTEESIPEAAAAPPPVPSAPAEEEAEDEADRGVQRASLDQPRDRTRSGHRLSYAPPSRSGTIPEQELHSEANDADLSAAGDITEDNEAEGDDIKPARQSVEAARAPAAPRQETDVGEEEGAAEESSEEDEMDAETRRRQELRERMAKMSGGMGMAGMFGAPMAGGAPQKKKKPTRESHAEEVDEPRSPHQAPPIPMIPIPGMQTVRSPEPEERELAVEKEDEEEAAAPITSERDPYSVPDVEDIKPEPAPRAELDRAVPPQSPSMEHSPPPVPASRPVPPPPAPEARAVPPPPSAAVARSDSEGSASDDELSARPQTSSVDTLQTTAPALPSRAVPPPVPATQGQSSPRSPQSAASRRASYYANNVASPTSPTSPDERRASRIPPIPSTGPLSPALGRAPPPPPPTAEPFAQAPPVPRPVPAQMQQEESEYEGDYDTDIASSVKHKDALKSHEREASLDESTTADETFHPVPKFLPPGVPPPHASASAPRAVPPPPPQNASNRMSMDAPRMAPPPPPRELEPEMEDDEDDEDGDDASSHVLPLRAVPPPPSSAPAPPPVPARQDSSDDLYSASPPRQSMDRPPPPPPHAAPPPAQDRSYPPTPTYQAAAPPFSPPTRQSTRQSLDVPRASMSQRRSMDQSRPDNNGFIATDVDMGEQTQWWTQPDLPPPVFQNRNDVLVEMEESSTPRRGGRTTIAKDCYILFIDYSQTVITARFDSREPTDVSFEQRHEPPPARLRQDQLEDFWQRYGYRINEAVASKKDSLVGDGSPRALVLDLIRPLQDALLPVGTRAYGALVYANLANASVQQFDEIRPGDIITLRNARMAGKHGTMHQKYAMDVGMQGREHVAVVVDWDGTKKKVRAWEQGREKAKVRMESFRLGDLKSGEVRVWRVVGRQWVGWETGS